MTSRVLSRLAAAVLMTAAAGSALVGTAAPAEAATCSTSSGVSVIVDFKQLGGGIQGACVAGGAGKAASTLFPSAGFPLDYVQNEPGFVCRVSSLPTPQADPCVDTPPTTAYWGLWWSDGKSGTWKYSNYGVAALKVPDGSYVALAWKQGEGSASPPGVAPAVHQAATPTPTASPTPTSNPTKTPTADPTKTPTGDPTKDPTKGPTANPTAGAPPTTSPGVSASASASASDATGASVSASPTQTGSPTDSAAPTPDATDSGSSPVVQDPAEPVDGEAADASEGGLPVVLVVMLIVALFAASGAAVVLRRRRAPFVG